MGSITTTPTIISLSFAAISVLLSATSTPGHHAAINPFCANATDEALCTQMAKNATTWPETMTNLMKAIIEKANASRPMVKGIEQEIPLRVAPSSREYITPTCLKYLDMIIYDLTECIDNINVEDVTGTQRVVCGRFAQKFTICTDVLEEVQVSLPEIGRLNQEFIELGIMLRSVIDKKPGDAGAGLNN